MKTRRARIFTRCAVRCVSKLNPYDIQVLGQGTANDTLSNLNHGTPLFINLTEVLYWGIQRCQMSTTAGAATTAFEDNIIRAFVEHLTVRLYINNVVGSTGAANGNKLHFRLMEFYLPQYTSYIATDAAGQERPQWSAIDPITGAATAAGLSNMWVGNQLGVNPNIGDWNFITSAPVNPQYVKFFKQRRLILRPIPNTGMSPGVNDAIKIFRWKPRRPVNFNSKVFADPPATNTFSTSAATPPTLTRYLGIVVDDFSLAPYQPNQNAAQFRADIRAGIRCLN